MSLISIDTTVRKNIIAIVSLELRINLFLTKTKGYIFCKHRIKFILLIYLLIQLLGL